MNPKTKKALNIVSYVLIGLIFLLGLIVLIMNLSVKNRTTDIPKLFGASVVVVESDSMKNTGIIGTDADEDKIPNPYGFFKKGDLIVIKRLADPAAKANLVKGDVITFYDASLNGGKGGFNTHKIVASTTISGSVTYTTRGVGLTPEGNQIPQTADGAGNDSRQIGSSVVLGVYQGKKLAGMGSVIGFFQSRLGFGLLIVLPLFAFLAYRVYVVVKLMIAINKEKKGGTTLSEMEKMQAEIEKLKAELGSGKPEEPPATPTQ